MNREGVPARLLRALWATRLAALAVAGPALGLLVLAATFGLSHAMLRLAAAMAAFAAALLTPIVRAEYRQTATRR